MIKVYFEPNGSGMAAERRYGPTSAPAIEIGPEYPPPAESPEIASEALEGAP